MALARAAPEVRLQADSAWALTAAGNGEMLRLPPGAECLVRPLADGLLVKSATETKRLPSRVEARAAEGRVRVNGVETASRLTVHHNAAAPDPSGLTVVAYLNLEEYLIGVLAGEVPYARWAPEALKAQAITSRSYALYQMQVRAGEPYDVASDESSQVFKAGVRANAVLNAAVNSTRGQALTCRGRLFPAYFHSCCGGTTERAETVFSGQEPVATLRGVTCPFCSASPVYTWSARIAREELRRRLAATAEAGEPAWGALSALEFVGRGGRAEQVRVRHGRLVTVLPANRFRLRVGPHELKSLWLDEVRDQGEAFEFRGRGFGHGVGLCQYGSQGMALQGYSAAQILGFYFPGGELTSSYARPAPVSR